MTDTATAKIPAQQSDESPYGQFILAVTGLSEHLREEVQSLRGQALSYVWGWEDASGVRNVRTDHDSWHFANAYGLYAAEFAAGKRSSRSPIQQCWKQWKATGSVLPLEGESWVS